jgi:hypothetical protein
MTYGTAAGVANLSNLWTDDGEWLDGDIYGVGATSPTLTTINGWLVEVSQFLDAALSDEGFSVPVAEVNVLSMLNGLVQGIVKDLADYSHGSGRYYTEQAIKQGVSPFMTMNTELSDWVKRTSVGLEAMGLQKTHAGRNVVEIRML